MERLLQERKAYVASQEELISQQQFRIAYLEQMLKVAEVEKQCDLQELSYELIFKKSATGKGFKFPQFH